MLKQVQTQILHEGGLNISIRGDPATHSPYCFKEPLTCQPISAGFLNDDPEMVLIHMQALTIRPLWIAQEHETGQWGFVSHAYWDELGITLLTLDCSIRGTSDWACWSCGRTLASLRHVFVPLFRVLHIFFSVGSIESNDPMSTACLPTSLHGWPSFSTSARELWLYSCSWWYTDHYNLPCKNVFVLIWLQMRREGHPQTRHVSKISNWDERIGHATKLTHSKFITLNGFANFAISYVLHRSRYW